VPALIQQAKAQGECAHGNFRPYNLNQPVLFPAAMRDCLEEDHLVFFVLDAVSKLDLSAIYAVYAERKGGQPPYDPSMMVALLLYGYCTGIRSSRRLEIATWEQIPFRVLTADQHPDHDTIAVFRTTHFAALGGHFSQVLRLATETGLVRFGHVALDGSKMKANAAKHKSRTHAEIEKESEARRAEMEELLRQAECVDAEEDVQYGKGVRGDRLPKDLVRRKDRLEKLEAAKQRIEARSAARVEETPRAKAAAKPKAMAKAQCNLTDMDSRVMPDGSTGEFYSGYNAQAVVDSDKQVIVAVGLTQSANDFEQAIPMMLATRANIGANAMKGMKVSMDAGYRSLINIDAIEGKDVDLHVSLCGSRSGTANAEEGNLPNTIQSQEGPCERMQRKMNSEEGQSLYRKRKAIVEPVFGHIKSILGFRQFSCRGYSKASHEWSLVCTVHNLLKLFRYGGWQDDNSSPPPPAFA